MSKIKRTHLEQLMFYVDLAEDRGTYYGNPKYFDKRHEEIIAWLEALLKNTRKDNK